jgi:hypothetical protein
MLDQSRLERVRERHVLAQGEDVPDHQFLEPGLRRCKQEVAHHHHALERARLVGDVAVGDEGLAGHLAQFLDRLGDGQIAREHAHRRRHQLAHRPGL